MISHTFRPLAGLLVAAVLCLAAVPALAAPYAALVMDARTGQVLHARNADARLHPASLTKMMTLYIAFEAVRRGELTMDTLVTVSDFAASEPPSKLGLRPGQKIALRYLVRAAAVKSANDAATAIAEAVSGSEEAFAERMNLTAKALGMESTTFRNAHGLTEQGHLSTARDMATLGRRLFFDYPQYYNLFARRTTHAGIAEVSNTNRKFLAAYEGADGIKTGYTRAAGFNLVASAERGPVRILASLFGGTSTPQRNTRMAELLDMGFERAPIRAAVRKPALPDYGAVAPSRGGRVIRASGAVTRSLRPMPRPGGQVTIAGGGEGTTVTVSPVPEPRAEAPVQLEVVTRLSTAGQTLWGVRVGRYVTKYEADKALIRVALSEIQALEGTDRRVVQTPQGWDARFVGLTRERAALACRKMHARGRTCETVGPT